MTQANGLAFRQLKQFFINPESDLSRGLSSAVRRPPQIASRILLWTVVALIGTGFAWASLSKFPSKAVARGNMTSTEPLVPIRANAGQRVTEVRVKEGDRVKKGDILIKLDANVANAEVQKLENLLAVTAENIKNLQIQIEKGTQGSVGVANSDIRSKLDAIAQSLANAKAEEERQQSILAQERAGQSRIQETLRKEQNRANKLRQACLTGAVAALQCDDADGKVREIQEELNAQEASVNAAQKELEKAQNSVAQLSSSNDAALREELKQIKEKKTLLESELDVARQQSKSNEILAPTDGTIENSDAAPGVLQASNDLMFLRPLGKQELEVRILQTDRGIVREGQPVEVKFDAYPAQDGYIVDGYVKKIDASTIDDPSLSKVYPARIQINEETLRQKRINLQTNLVATAEIVTDQRRSVLQFILDPILKSIERATASR